VNNLHTIPPLAEETELAMLKMEPWRLQLLLARPKVHRSQVEMFRDASGMTLAGLTSDQQLEILRYKFASYYRPIEDREIENAIRGAMNNGVVGVQKEKMPKVNEELRQAALETSAFKMLSDLKLASKTKNPELLSSGAILSRLFSADQLVCMASDKATAHTGPRNYFSGREERLPFIVPNAMAAEFGLTTSGRTSRRCNDNVGPITRTVVEFDTGTLDEQAALIGAIAACGVALDMVLWSGGKSLHAWFDLANLADEERQKFFRYAAALGADKATFVPCQLCRTPNATRTENGNKQEVLLLNVESRSEENS
jgi:hypothetical protein